MSIVDITKRKYDLKIDKIKCYNKVATISAPRIRYLEINRKGIAFTSTKEDNPLYVSNLEHAKYIKKAIDTAIELGWFNDTED